MKVRRALLSVSDKRGIVEFARGLAGLGIELVSTGGTARELTAAGLEVRAIEDFTGFPEILDGRVKTLHPKLHAGLLALRDDPSHMVAVEERGVELVDLVCVNLYPFERVAGRRGATEHEAIENIDIGGPTMIRAAAKNFGFIAPVTRPELPTATPHGLLCFMIAQAGTLNSATSRRPELRSSTLLNERSLPPICLTIESTCMRVPDCA